MKNVNVEYFYEGAYGDGTHFVAMKETDGSKTILLREVCRSVAGETANALNAGWLKGNYTAGKDDYVDLCVGMMHGISVDRSDPN